MCRSVIAINSNPGKKYQLLIILV